MPFRAVLFDFDGTLADSFGPITASTNDVRRQYGLPDLSEAVVREYVGLGLANLMETLVPSAPVEEAVARYREHHVSVMFRDTRLLPGVAETLATLQHRGYRQAVCSNKRVDFTRRLVHDFGLERHFEAILGPEDVGVPKPDPAMLLEALRRLEVSANETIYVGDMAIDVQVARAAGIGVWLVPGGAGRGNPADSGPDRMLTSFSELLDLLAPVAGA